MDADYYIKKALIIQEQFGDVVEMMTSADSKELRIYGWAIFHLLHKMKNLNQAVYQALYVDESYDHD